MGFCHFLEHLVINIVKKLIDTATKIGIDAAKTPSKRVVYKTAEVIGDLVGNKVADKITSVRKAKSKVTENETNKRQEICIPAETKNST